MTYASRRIPTTIAECQTEYAAVRSRLRTWRELPTTEVRGAGGSSGRTGGARARASARVAQLVPAGGAGASRDACMVPAGTWPAA